MPDSGEFRPDNYPKLSRQFSEIRPAYDVVVIGSGYGAGVAASRFARAGKSVAVLELGWEVRRALAGSFPRTTFEVLKRSNISTPSENTVLKKIIPSDRHDQLYQLVLGDGQHAFKAHGLGGCSLINAGVFLQADEATLQMSSWPSEIRDNPSALQPYYSRAAAMLAPSSYPDQFPDLYKLTHLQDQTSSFGKYAKFYRAPLTISFCEGRNSTGVVMQPNRGTGHECTGLNDGSKNSVAVTYLTDAWNWGAEIFCGCEVRFVQQAPRRKGYIVHFARHGAGRSAFSDEFQHQLFWVKANEFCFLGAGALGTTEILHRSKANGLSLSPMVGQNMSGNGDLLAFGYNGLGNVNGIATTSDDNIRPGPTITGVVDARATKKSQNPLEGYIVQDGCIPEPFTPVIQILLMMQTIRSRGTLSLWRQLRAFAASAKSLVLGAQVRDGAIQRTSTYLVMSHDSNELALTMKNDRMLLKGPAEGRSAHFARLKAILGESLHRHGAKIGFSYYYWRNRQEVTVHPLGGANMSRDGTGLGGVVNHVGQVFTGHSGEVYKGLVCCDASIIPSALGVNPLATITALAERSVSLLAKQSGIHTDLDTTNGELDFLSQPRVSINKSSPLAGASIGWQFTEVLSGFFCSDPNITDHAASESNGKRSSCAIKVFLTTEIHRMLPGHERPSYEGRCTGTVSCFALSRSTLNITSGRMEFFCRDATQAESTGIKYHLKLDSVEGDMYELNGFKSINSSISFSPLRTWHATTMVRFRVARNGDSAAGGTGVVKISMPRFLNQLRSFRTDDTFKLFDLLGLVTFLAFFIYNIAVFFFRPCVPVQSPESLDEGNARPKPPPSHIVTIKAEDGVQTSLEIYEPQLAPESDAHPSDINRPPVLCLPGVTGVGAEFSVYALPYLRCNAIDYFTARGHRCYALVPRWGCEEAVADKATVFDCRLDVAAAVEYVYNTERRKAYIIAHCQGSVALGMGLLDEKIPRGQILGITANSVFMNQVFGYWNSLKGRTTALISLYEILAGRFFPMFSSNDSSAFQRVLDGLLRFYPVSARRDICSSTACHRTSFGFGLLWNHENLNHETHKNIHRFFAGTHTTLLKHVVRMGTRGQCLDNRLRPLLTSKHLQRLEGVPILFISGTDNEVFNPESTLRDYEMLRRTFGEAMYRRYSPDGYGHLDPIMGKNAVHDVYWKILDHIRWCGQQKSHLKIPACVLKDRNGETEFIS